MYIFDISEGKYFLFNTPTLVSDSGTILLQCAAVKTVSELSRVPPQYPGWPFLNNQ